MSLLNLLTPSAAIAGSTTGNISGKVVDETGTALPGVVVTARDPANGLERAVTTDTAGKYDILGLPPAVYVVQATNTGSGALPRTVVVNLGQTVLLNFDMKPGGGLEERVTVTAEAPLLNTTKSELSTVVTEKEILSYPLLNRDYTDLAVLAPGVRLSPTGLGWFTTGGTTGANLNMSIDGVDNNQTQSGFALQGFPADGIEEFEVIQDQAKAEYGRSSGAVVNVITKSGTNDFGGSVFSIFRNQDMRSSSFSERLADTEKGDATRYQYGLSVGGPMVKNSLFYFVAAERQNEQTPIALSPDLTQYAGTEPPGFPFRIAPPGTTFQQDFTRNLSTAKFNWNASPHHLFWARYSADKFNSLNDQGGTLTNPDSNGDSRSDIWSAAASWQWLLGGKAINELRILKSSYSLGISIHSPETLTLWFDSFGLGQNANNGGLIDIQEKLQFRDDVSWLVGRHSFKAGFEVIPVKQSVSLPFTLPVFVFNGGITPADTMVSGDMGTTNGTAANGVDDGIDVVGASLIFAPFNLVGRYKQFGAYFQDDWEVNERWRLNLGLRLDLERGVWQADQGANKLYYECLADPANNAKCGRDPATVNAPAGIEGFDRTFPKDPTNLSPRLGFVYRVGGGDTDVVRGSWGLFYDYVISNFAWFNWVNNCPNCFPQLPPLTGCDPSDLANCSATTTMTAGTVILPGLPPLPTDFTLNNWVNDPRLQAWIADLTAAARPGTLDDNLQVGLISPDWKAPYTSAFSFGWGHSFRPGLALDTNFIYRRGIHQMRVETYAGGNSGREAPWPTFTDPNTGVATYPGFLNIFTTDGKAEFYSLQLSLRGHAAKFDFGANLNLSEARGTQDNAGTGANGSVTSYGFDGGNIQATGGSIDSEWGRISGNQPLYVFLYGIYRFPHGFQTSAQVAYGSRVSVRGYAGTDVNGDGFDLADYVGTRGGSLGGDLFYINTRVSKLFTTGKGTSLEAFLDIFNLTNRDNYSTFVNQQQLTFDGSQNRPNPDYLTPNGTTLTPPRTLQVGMRFQF